MRLYTTTGATQVDDPEYGTFTADANGAFDGLPDAMYAKLHGFPGWENDAEREMRITTEELDRFRDPAELLKAVKELGANQGILTAAIASALGLTRQAAPTQDTAIAESSNISKAESDSAKADGGSEASPETQATSDESASAPKATTGRGRGSKSAKAATSDAS